MLQGGNGQAATVFDKDEVVAFIIKGTFSGTRVSDATRYWRVNLLKDDAWKYSVTAFTASRCRTSLP